jgi:hypothetical protein
LDRKKTKETKTFEEGMPGIEVIAGDSMEFQHISPARIHPWLRTVHLSFVPGPSTGLLEKAAPRLLEAFRELGHVVQERPDDRTDLVLTTAPFAQPVNWRRAALFTVRRAYGLTHTPTVLTLIHARPQEFRAVLDHLEQSLAKEPQAPADFSFPGMADGAYQTLIEQGLRGGAIMALERVLQAQSKSIRILLVVGEDDPLESYLFDLVGAHPRGDGRLEAGFYRDLALRLATIMSTREVADHQAVGEEIPAALWGRLSVPGAMIHASRELGRRDFFTPTVHVARLVSVPAVEASVAEQYSEGCFASWEPELGGLVATITGSARPVEKGHITTDDLAVIVGVRPDRSGALVRHVAGRRNDPPSSEAVELMDMDTPLPRISFSTDGAAEFQVPVIRSKLHGHRGVSAFHPRQVEFAPLDPAYHHYPVSCATEAQAEGIRGAFARSEALRDPLDPRQVVFTVLPGHGVVIAEKWDRGKVPFQTIWECMDSGALQIASRVPQGYFTYEQGGDGSCHLRE